MYLSQLILNPRSRQVRSELARPYELHRTVMSGFVDKSAGERVLYRLDISSRDGIPRLLVQSQQAPDWSNLQAKADYLLELPGGNPQVREHDPHLFTGQRLAFRLLANPTRSLPSAARTGAPDEKRERGKRVSLVSAEDQAAWLDRKAAEGGFRVAGLRITDLGGQHLAVPGEDKSIHAARHQAVRYDGELVVTDPSAFRKILECGVGSAKGFGYGLLTVAPV